MLKLQDYMRERSAKQKLTLGAVFVAAFIGILLFSWFANKPTMALLYAGLEPSQAGSIISAVEKSGIPYEVRGDSIWVRQKDRDQLRMTLAGSGLPASGSAGYEILDNMSGFGTTSQMFDAAYWRAKEGELGRTILALPNVKSARVHLAVPPGRGYRREAQASASVTLMTNGTAINPAQARALRYLISSGVPGMPADNVTVIDSDRGVIPSSEDTASETRADEMKRNVERILEPHVGVGNAVVELNLDLVTEAELLTEQRFDPQERALISQENEESSDQNTNSSPGAVTAASNLPEGQGESGEQSRSARSETRQRTNFEVSRTMREVRRQPGDIRRLTVAVLVNGTTGLNENGEEIMVPRSEQELQAIRELVSSAVGYNESRGDQLTVKSLLFLNAENTGTTSAHSMLQDLELVSLARIVIVGLFALALVYLIQRSIMRTQQQRLGPENNLLDASGSALKNVELSTPSSPNADLRGDLPPAKPSQDPEIDFVPLSPQKDDPVDRLKSLMKSRQEESIKILSGWIERKEEA